MNKNKCWIVNSISRRIQIFGKTLPVTLGSIHLWTMIIIFLLTYYNRNLIRFFLTYIRNLMRWKSRKHLVKLHINYGDNSYLNALNSVDKASCFSNQNIEFLKNYKAIWYEKSDNFNLCATIPIVKAAGFN